jgi:prephenate dehydrogenase
MHVAFIGFGLIGGSIARAIKANATDPRWTVSAWSPSGVGPRRAAADGVIDRSAGSPEDALTDADLVVLAGPATTGLAALDALAGPWRVALPAGAVVTDVASTKTALLDRADVGVRFVGGHPIAARTSGTSPVGLTSSIGRGDRARARRRSARCRPGRRPCRGAAPGRAVDAATHDRAVAASTTCRSGSAALVETVAGTTPAPLATGGTSQATCRQRLDTTRLARGIRGWARPSPP